MAAPEVAIPMASQDSLHLLLERDEAAVKEAQANFMAALGSISQAHHALVEQFQHQQRLGEIWSEANSKDFAILAAHLQKLDARVVTLSNTSGLEARFAELDNRLDQRLETQERQHKSRIEECLGFTRRNIEDLQTTLKKHCDRSVAAQEDRIRDFVKSCLEGSDNRHESLRQWARECIEAEQKSTDTKLHDLKHSCNAQVQEILVSTSANREKMDSLSSRVTDLDHRAGEHRCRFDRLFEKLEGFAMTVQIVPMEARLVTAERHITSLNEKIAASEAHLKAEDKLLRDDLNAEAEARKASDAPFAELDQRFDEYKERVRRRFDNLQEDLSSGREWSVRRFEAHAEALRVLEAQKGKNVSRVPSKEVTRVPSKEVTSAVAPDLDEEEGLTRDDLLDVQERISEMARWIDRADHWQDQFSTEVDHVHRLAKLVEERTERLLGMELHIEELMHEAQRVLEINMACTTKCLSCGTAAAQRAANVNAPRDIPSPPRLRSPSPPKEFAGSAGVHSVPQALAVLNASKNNERNSRVLVESSPESIWSSAMPVTTPRQRSRPGSAPHTRNAESTTLSDRSRPGSAAGTGESVALTAGPKPAGTGMAACRSNTVSFGTKGRRPDSARASLHGETAKKSIA